MNNFPHLFEPIEIGKTTVKNRIFMPPISTNMADKGYVTDDLVAHYSARAKGGVGLIVTEVCHLFCDINTIFNAMIYKVFLL